MESIFTDRKFDKRKLEISDLNLKKRLRRVTPLIQKGDKLYTFKPGHLRNTPFIWDPQDLQEVDASQYKELMCTEVQFSYTYKNRFNPTIAEVLAQLPNAEEIVAFYLDDNMPITVLVDGEGHEITCHWLGNA